MNAKIKGNIFYKPDLSNIQLFFFIVSPFLFNSLKVSKCFFIGSGYRGSNLEPFNVLL